MNHDAGFTLTELLIVLALVAILTTAAIPASNRWIASHRLETGLQTMLRSLALARSEAVKRAGRVSLLNSGNGWEEGWIVFYDYDGNALLTGDDEIIWQQASTKGIRIKGNASVQNLITYRSDGVTVLPSNAFQAGTLFFCPEAGQIEPYKLVIAKSGRPRTERMPRGDAACD